MACKVQCASENVKRSRGNKSAFVDLLTEDYSADLDKQPLQQQLGQMLSKTAHAAIHDEKAGYVAFLPFIAGAYAGVADFNLIAKLGKKLVPSTKKQNPEEDDDEEFVMVV